MDLSHEEIVCEAGEYRAGERSRTDGRITPDKGERPRGTRYRGFAGR